MPLRKDDGLPPPSAHVYLRNRRAVLAAEDVAERWCSGLWQEVRALVGHRLEAASAGAWTATELRRAAWMGAHGVRYTTADTLAHIRDSKVAGTSSVQMMLDAEDTFQAGGEVDGAAVRISLAFNSNEAFRTAQGASSKLLDKGARFAATRDRMRVESTVTLSTASWIKRFELPLSLDGTDGPRIAAAIVACTEAGWTELLQPLVPPLASTDATIGAQPPASPEITAR